MRRYTHIIVSNDLYGRQDWRLRVVGQQLKGEISRYELGPIIYSRDENDAHPPQLDVRQLNCSLWRMVRPGVTHVPRAYRQSLAE